MFTKLVRFFVMLPLICSIGLHWFLLQSVAWVSLIVSYSQLGKLGDANSTTFDVKHPGKLSKSIEQGRKSERSSDSKDCLREGEKLDLVLLGARQELRPPPSMASILLVPGCQPPAMISTWS